ncbi:SET domain-containing protein [Martensiomyces pterosporus]|nr:SET domain-containing protein [Martensiomyces pterosporus]
MAALAQAVTGAGGSISEDIRVCATPYGGRGVYAKKAALGELARSKAPLAHIPSSRLITIGAAAQSDIVLDCLAACDEAAMGKDSVALSLLLLTERALDTQSEWKWYIDTLPQAGSSGLYFDSTDLAALQPTPLSAAITAKLRQLQHQYACFADVLERWKEENNIGGPVGFDAYKWANFIVLSRAISIQSFLSTPDADTVSGDFSEFPHAECDRALLPFLDMFNHSESPTAFWTFKSDGSAMILAGSEPDGPGIDIDGESFVELHFSYGRNPNTEWLYAHGFLPENNAHDYWPYFPAFGGSSQMMQIKQKWLHELGISPRISFADPDNHHKDVLQSDGYSCETDDYAYDSDDARSGYVGTTVLLKLCLAFLSDTSDDLRQKVGSVEPKPPGVGVGDALVNDAMELPQIPGLRAFVLEQCICSLQDVPRAMRASINMSRKRVINDYLRKEAALVERVVGALRQDLSSE